MSATIVETLYGKVKGKKIENIYVWKGIPFAKPPVGKRRFQHPEPPATWAGVRNATAYSLAAPQPKGSMKTMLPVNSRGEVMSEDCLYLNIWSPAPDGKRRPVMVWIHGGAYVTGSGTSSRYDGAAFARNGDVVFVTINYRLGALGFLQLDEIGGDPYAASGVCGLMDQIEALRWIRDNIAAFGGDPHQVTIFGQSSGAGSVSAIMAMPESRGLFHKAIIQSWSSDSTMPKEDGWHTTRGLLQKLGIEKTNAISTLQQMPAEMLIKAASQLPMMSLRPVEDGQYLPEAPLKAFANGVADQIPVMTGATLEEFWFAAHHNPVFRQNDQQKMIDAFYPSVGPFWDEVAPYYFNCKEVNSKFSYQLKSLVSFHRYNYPTIKLAETLAQRPAPIWFYRFDYRSPIYGACHSMDVPFVFHQLDLPAIIEFTGASPEREKVADAMHYAWISFARTSDPNHAALPAWSKYDLEQRETMIFNVESKQAFDPDQEERTLFRDAEKKLGITHRPLWNGHM